VAYTCETAGYFWLIHILARWEKFTAALDKARAAGGGPELVGQVRPRVGRRCPASLSVCFLLHTWLGPSQPRRGALPPQLFPFAPVFEDAPQPLFTGESFEADMERARGCFRHLRTLFQARPQASAAHAQRGTRCGAT
jgi:intron-binding protein aquarius